MFVVAEEQDFTCSFKSAIIFSKAQIIQHTHTHEISEYGHNHYSVYPQRMSVMVTRVYDNNSKKKLFPVRPERLLRRRKSRKQKHWP